MAWRWAACCGQSSSSHRFCDLRPGVDFSDHLPYWNVGYPAVMITDTAFYRNLAYHTEGDTPDRLDYDKMAGVVLGVYQAVHRLAGTRS